MEAHLNNIITGVIATIIFYVFIEHILPHITGYITKIPNISGTWERIIDNGNNGYAEFKIKQTGNRIKANAKLHDGNQVREFIYKGFFYPNQLILTFEQKDAAKTNIGSSVFILDSRNSKLKGKHLYYHHDSNEIKTLDVEYQKILKS